MKINEAKEVSRLIEDYETLDRFIKEFDKDDMITMYFSGTPISKASFNVYEGCKTELFNDIKEAFEKELRKVKDKIEEEY